MEEREGRENNVFQGESVSVSEKGRKEGKNNDERTKYEEGNGGKDGLEKYSKSYKTLAVSIT